MIITRIWRDQPGKYFCISSKSRSGNWEDTFFKRNQFKDVKAFLESNRDKDLYFCPHGFTKPRRVKSCVDMPKLLWADLDEINPRDLEVLPTVAWESSPGRFACVWLLDTFMDEELNRRMTYAIGADKGGWDFTQVLRIPGTTNYKYMSTPKVRMLWSDGPVHHREQVEDKLPKTQKGSKGTRAVHENIYRKYEKHLSPFVRRELLKGKPQAGKRSEVLWKLINGLVEAGMSEDEVFEVIRVSPWNKFAGRRDADEQLKREIKKVVGRHLEVGNKLIIVDDDENEDEEEDYDSDDEDDEDDRDNYKFLSKPMSEVEEENMDWIWYPYLARGELTILEGDPGLGKSYLAQMVAIGIVDGKRLPSVKKLKPVQGKIAYFDLENSAGTVTRKRLVANGCVNLKEYFQEEEPFSIDDEFAVERVYAAVEKLNPTLVVFDTINTYMGKTDTNNGAQVQQSFKVFREIAKRFDCSVLVLRHLTKSTKEKAIYRGQGSISFTGLARVVMTVGVSPDDPDTRCVAVTKINVTKPPKALTYKIQELEDTLKEQDRSRFVWGTFVDLTADDIISVQPRKETEKSEDAKKFLEEVLDDGPMEFNALRRAAENRNISMRQMNTAAEELRVEKTTKGFGTKKKTYWEI